MRPPRKPAKGPKAKPRDREQTTVALRDAAAEVFAESGYEASTTRAIAERAGFAEGLIHRYFEGKAGLLLAVISHFLAEDAARWAAEPADDAPGDLEESLLRFLTSGLEHHAATGPSMRVAIARALVDPKFGAEMGRSIEAHHVPAIERELARHLPRREGFEDAAFLISSLSYVVGFLGPQVFGFPKARMRRVAKLAASIIASNMRTYGAK